MRRLKRIMRIWYTSTGTPKNVLIKIVPRGLKRIAGVPE